MRYIRIKDAIYEYEKVKTRVFIQEGVYSKEKLLSEEESLKLFPYEIIKQADTIEELCDEFVYIGEKGNVVLGMSYMQIEDVKKYNVNKNQIYGAIWTEKGLIYVAKMNDKGELELL